MGADKVVGMFVKVEDHKFAESAGVVVSDGFGIPKRFENGIGWNDLLLQLMDIAFLFIGVLQFILLVYGIHDKLQDIFYAFAPY